MKILTQQEQEEHYNATVKGGITGGVVGLSIGGALVYGANARFPAFRQLTLPMKAFLVTSSTTFASIVSADRASRQYENARDPQRQYRDKASSDLEQARSRESAFQGFKDWGRENRYPIVTVSWVASMGVALSLVGRNPYLTRAQKLVQARLYAQGLTLAVLLATAAFEVGDASKGKGRWETVKILDPNDPEHKHIIEKRVHHEAYAGEDLWRDMVAAEERKMAARKTNEQDRNGSAKSSSSASTGEKTRHDSPAKAHGNEGKDKHVSAATPANRRVRVDGEEREAKNSEAQNEKLKDAKAHSGADVKIKDLGGYQGQ